MADPWQLNPMTLGNLGMGPPVAPPMVQAPAPGYSLRPETLAQLNMPAPAVAPPGPPPGPAPVAAPRGMVEGQRTVVSGAPVDTSRYSAAAEGTAAATADVGKAAGQAIRDEAQAKIDGLTALEQTQNQAVEQERAKAAAAAEGRAKLLAQDPGKVNPTAFAEKLGIGGTLAAIAAAALVGALRAKAGMNPDENPVVSAVNAEVDRSIALQREAIAQKRADRSEGLAYYEKQFGDAQTAMRADVWATAEHKFTAMGEKHRGTPLEAQAMANAQSAREQKELHLAQLDQAGAARVQQTFTQKPVVKGSSREAQLAEALKLDQALEKSGYGREQRAELLGKMGFAPPSGKTEAELAREDKAANDPMGVGKIPGQRRADAKAAYESLGEVGRSVGLTRNKAGKWEGGIGATANVMASKARSAIESIPIAGDIAGVGMSAVAGANEFENAKQLATENLGRLQSGGAITDKELPVFEKLVAGAKTAADLADRLNRIEDSVKAKGGFEDLVETPEADGFVATGGK
jgi:hypothetical protein